MADIFVSFSRLDQDRVRPILERLGSLGYSVWWDKSPGTGPVSDAEIEHQVAEARCVLAVWSANARNAISVCAEAARALDEDKLVQVRIDSAAPPAPFDAAPLSDLSPTRTEWGPLEHTLAQKLRGAANEEQAGDVKWGILATAGAAGPARLVTIACCTVLLAYLIAVVAAFSGVMNIDQLQITLTGVMLVGAVCAILSASRLFAIGRADAPQ